MMRASPVGQISAIVAVLVLFLSGVVVKLHAPLTFWDSALIQWAVSASPAEPPVWTSTLYPLAVKLMAWIGWLDPVRLRWFNVTGAIFTGALTFSLARRLWGSAGAGVIAFSLYMLHPAVIQGIQSLDGADASFFPAAYTLWILAFLSSRPDGWRRAVLLGLAGAWAIAWKATSALALLLYPPAGISLGLRGKRNVPSQCRDLLATVAGFAAFVLPWWLFGDWGTLPTLVASALSDLTSRTDTAIALRTAFHAALGAAWLGPFLGLLALWGAILLFRQNNLRVQAVLTGTATYALGYLLVGGLNHGYPRYHVAVLPIVCAVAAVPASFQRWNKTCWLAVALLAFAFWGLVGDPVRTLNLGAREAMLAGILWPFLARTLLPLAVWFAVVAGVKPIFAFSWQKTFLLSILAGSLALGIVQSVASYATCYGYGEQGRRDVLEWIERTVPSGRASVLSPPNMTAELRQRGIHGPSHTDWKTEESVKNFIAQAVPSAVVLSVTENTMWQLKSLLDDPPAALRACRDHYVRIGTYWVCDPLR